MSKNPLMNCKSRKQRKNTGPILEPKEKLFCPRTMVRYDNTKTVYSTVWSCKMCLKILLSEEAARSHVINCNDKKQKLLKPKQEPKDDVVLPYICSTCNKVFSRSVALKRHVEVHQKPPSDFESEESDNEMADNGKRVKIKAEHIKKEYI
ncbi:uncharacterized protein LOC126551735 [Aphis gossypii]|uniref:C2H2-type domain-containing protein n=1 Tax=Aphis gossypii TaxID=80765 RepID=A0A9P0NN88_APHGO|nr:uncharacterized protein LOC126551734 [Aphis gossypii]XP_050061759.1 uncharacterized protein LOC126551735 [Aphis gossypii]XP_050061760.1 uncharacterized protein LOC126551735 [Aphis gossypii]XP_050061761.1 uncharacterized protein LOC126551735 [Aphis gossypii]CAH1733317.1 unnamed protein product [Aphis gossypii]CAH1733318.1 unnamed protein product [Aphis gossypii]